MSRPLYGAIEAGGTKFVCAAGHGPADLLPDVRVEIPTSSPAATLRAVAAFFEQVCQERGPLSGIGIAAFGPVDLDGRSPGWGRILATPKPGWSGTSLTEPLQHFGCPIAIDTDVNAAALAESHMGAGVGLRSVAYVTVGTGIGGGIVIDGKLYHGSSDVAGEIGHTTIDSTGRYCRCGNYGCLEAYASGPAIALRAREALERDEVSALHKMVKGDLDLLTAATVYEAAHRGDALALEVVRDTARFLGTGIANLLNTVNPDVVVITGGVTRAGDRLFEPLRAEVKRRAFRPAVAACRIVPGALEGTAGVVGAVATFKQQKLGEV